MTDNPNTRQSAQRKGGIIRSKRLAPGRRSEIAARAAQARWKRGVPGVTLAGIEDLQMNSDVIDAADILVTELNEQAALLSQTGVNALSNGHLTEAKLIIGAIEQTQTLINRAKQLQADISLLHSALAPESHGGIEATQVIAPDAQENGGKKQDRTDPVLMNAKRNKIIILLEGKHGVRLHRRSAAIYRSDSNAVGIVCTMSKWHPKNDNYWYAYHPHQDEFLATTKLGYFVLGMMDSEIAIALPVEVIRQNLDKLNTTMTLDGRSYWHIHISRSEGGRLSLQRARGEPPLPLDRYIVQIGS